MYDCMIKPFKACKFRITLKIDSCFDAASHNVIAADYCKQLTAIILQHGFIIVGKNDDLKN